MSWAFPRVVKKQRQAEQPAVGFDGRLDSLSVFMAALPTEQYIKHRRVCRSCGRSVAVTKSHVCRPRKRK